jgi:hypothetical protein
MPIVTSRRIFIPPHSDPTLTIDGTIRRGHKGPADVRICQEWLCLNDHNVAIDGDFGYATEQAVRDFQSRNGTLAVTGEIDPATFAALVQQMVGALRLISLTDEQPSFSSMVATYAYQHLQQRPREVGGQNRGPWVRLYLREHQRALDPKLPQSEWAWCAGFASTLLEQASATLGRPSPLAYHWNCTGLGTAAHEKRLFVTGEEAHKDPARIPAGSLFLIRKGQRGHYHHTGVVVHADTNHVRTIEGNTSGPEDTVPRGHEVAMHTRDYGTLDFVVLHEH